jgi:hypothetical protein
MCFIILENICFNYMKKHILLFHTVCWRNMNLLFVMWFIILENICFNYMKKYILLFHTVCWCNMEQNFASWKHVLISFLNLLLLATQFVPFLILQIFYRDKMADYIIMVLSSRQRLSSNAPKEVWNNDYIQIPFRILLGTAYYITGL